MKLTAAQTEECGWRITSRMTPAFWAFRPSSISPRRSRCRRCDRLTARSFHLWTLWRTVILDDGQGQPDALIEPPVDITLEIVRADSSAPHRFVADWLRTRVRRPFALNGLLIDAALIEFSGDRSLLL